MARISTPAIWLPGPLNTLNSPSPTGQSDIAGNPYYMGMNPGKLIVLGTNEAQNSAAPGTTLYDGSYQVVLLDSSATAAYATEGYAAYIRLDSGATQGANPETDYPVPTVTTGDVAATIYGSAAGALAFFCGVFINPATVSGQANGPTPGNYTVIFAGGGRTNVTYGGTAAADIGAQVLPSTDGVFEAVAPPGAYSNATSGIATTIPATDSVGVAYYKDIIFRFPN